MDGSHSATNRRIAPQTEANDERRLKLVKSAYDLIAEKGMAGLRIREVASHVGLNHSTLLYYFPTKESLIQGVVGYCIQQFELIHAPDAPVYSTAGEQLHQRYLSDLAYQLREAPELFLVLDEFLLYARRDSATRRVLTEAVELWQQVLEASIQEEMASGRFRADLDVRSAALTLISFCQGISLLLNTQPKDIDGILAQFEHWFLSLSSPQE